MNVVPAKKQTINLYKGLGWKSFFAKIRFWDAPFFEVEELVPQKSKIIDLGCGEGIFTNFLGLLSKKREILGIELDRNRVQLADRGLNNVTFKTGDATKANLPQSDVIILFHLLHHLNSYEQQEKLLEKCVKSLSPKGKLIIVEAESNLSFKFLITWFTDCFLVAWLFEKRFYSPIFFRNLEGWQNLIKKLGLSYRLVPITHRKPFTHIILECQKRKD